MQKVNKLIATKSLRFIMLFSVVAFVFYFIWEYAQCALFFRHIETPANLGAMISATIGDILMTGAVYVMTAISYLSSTWFEGHWSLRSTITVGGFSVVLAILVELWGLRGARWAYTENNPVLPVLGVSILPLLQMALINPVSMFGSKIILTSLARAKH